MRILQKKTQKELSEQTGLNNATISRMLNGARSGRPYKSTIDKIAKAIDDPELIQELYDATGYSSKKIRERKKIIADNGFSLDLSTVQVHEKFFSTLMRGLSMMTSLHKIEWTIKSGTPRSYDYLIKLKEGNIDYWYIRYVDRITSDEERKKALTAIYGEFAKLKLGGKIKVSCATPSYEDYDYFVTIPPYQLNTNASIIHFIDFLYWVKSGKHTEHNTQTSNKTCNMYLGAVFRYYQFLALEDVLPMLKVLRVKKVSYFDSMGVNHQNAVNSFKGFFKEEEPNLEEITSEEIQELINACTNDRDRLLIAMMAETGLRLGEILGIHYTEDIDFERRTVRVRYRESNTNLARAKNAEYRIALLSNTTFEFLVKYISDNRKSLMNSEYLFTKLTGKNKGEPLDADSVYSMLKRLSKKTDINSHPHQLRHYFAEERRKEGWDLNDIRFALGHKKVETTIKYLGENNERLIEATDQYYSNNEDLYQIADFL